MIETEIPSQKLEPLLYHGDLSLKDICEPDSKIVFELLSKIISVLDRKHPYFNVMSKSLLETEIRDLKVMSSLNDYFTYSEVISGLRWSRKDRLLFRLKIITAGAFFAVDFDRNGRERRSVVILNKAVLEKKLVHELTHVGQSILGYLDYRDLAKKKEYQRKIHRVQLFEAIAIGSLSGGIAIACLRPDQAIAIRMLAASAALGTGGILPSRNAYKDDPNEAEAFEMMELVGDK